MKEGIRMMEANNWPRLTSVMRHWREAAQAAHWVQRTLGDEVRPGVERLGGAEGGQRGDGTGPGLDRSRAEGGHMGLDGERTFGDTMKKCRIQRNMRGGRRRMLRRQSRRRMVGRKGRRRKMDRARSMRRNDSRHGGCDEEGR